MDDDNATDSCVYCGVMNIQALDGMALAINLIINRGVDPDATLLGTLDQDVVLHFKTVVQHMVEMKKLPNNTQPNTTEFKNWCTTIE